MHHSIAWGLLKRNESLEIPQENFFAAIKLPFGMGLGLYTDIDATIDPIRASGNRFGRIFGTRTAIV
ncbi:MAG: hypothetical protein NTU79_10665 [Planctomycetota bacterium]|nr:hypothetical protein [Planctomycetota bacterium]